VIRAGDLREVVAILAPVETRDAFGAVVTTWQELDVAWCRVVTQKGDEALRAASTDARQSVRVQLRYRDDITPTMRLSWNGREYDIRDVDDSLRHHGELWLTLVGTVR
jgi:SPP1 family predicted phage head-tail adaptor